jgi:broad specificity phosphatase PhoE
MNWDGSRPIEDFLTDRARSVRDRDYMPRAGDSSRQATERLYEFVQERADAPTVVAVVTHGGVPAELLCTLVGDPAVAASLKA